MGLPGISNASPIPRRSRFFKPASGTAVSTGNLRPVVLVANKLSSGTEVVETLGGPIQSLSDCYTRFGQRSEMAWMYRAYTAVDASPIIYGVAVADGASATASTCNFQFVNAATQTTSIDIWSCKGLLQVAVNPGDTAVTIASNVINAINADPDLPFSAAVDGTNAYQVDITTSQKGPRSAYWINQLRMLNDNPANATTITKSSVTAGSVADSVANAIVAVNSKEFTYHTLAATSQSSVSSSDGGIGQYLTYIASIIAPLGNKSSMAIFAVDGTSAQATAVTQSATVNQVFAHCYRTKNNDWHPAMTAAHHTAVHRFAETNYAAANLAGWTNNSILAQVYQIPPPYNAADVPTTTDMTTDLNGGVSTVGFQTSGQSYIVRSVTTYSWTGASSTADYRAREGHIPSVMIAFWDALKSKMIAQNQPNVASDPPAGGKPVAGFMYPRNIISIANSLILAMTKAYQNNMALLDPSVLKDMLAATDCQLSAGGFELDTYIAAVRHNLFDDVTISEIGPAY